MANAPLDTSETELILSPDQLTFDPRLQMREFTDESHTEELAERLPQLPSPRAVKTRAGEYLIWDGWHTAQAHILKKRPGMPVRVRDGEFDDALLLAAGANAAHGLKRTPEDKARQVTAIVTHPKFRELPVSRVAEICHVSEAFVRPIRDMELARRDAEVKAAEAAQATGRPAPKKKPAKPEPAKVRGKDNKMYPAKKRPKPSGKVKINWPKFDGLIGQLSRFLDDLYRNHGQVNAEGAVKRDAEYREIAGALKAYQDGVKKRAKELTKEADAAKKE